MSSAVATWETANMNLVQLHGDNWTDKSEGDRNHNKHHYCLCERPLSTVAHVRIRIQLTNGNYSRFMMSIRRI